MYELSLGPDASLTTVLEKLRQLAEKGEKQVLLVFPEDTPMAQNALNLKVLKQEAARLSITIQIKGDSPLSEEVAKSQTTKDDFGFVQGGDVLEVTDKEREGGSYVGRLPKGVATKVSSFFTSLFNKLSRKLSSPPKISFPKKFVWIGGAVLLLGAALFGVFFFLPSATVTLAVNAEALVKSVPLEASSSAQGVDREKGVIPGVVLSTTKQLKKDVSASGSKEVGDNAKGTVTIYNKTDSEKTFKVGEVISKGQTQGDDLRFLLSNDVVAPARTATESAEVTTYFSGKVDVGATAESFGEEYNLVDATTFTVGDYPTAEFIAEAKGDFFGGTKRTITVVSEDDLSTLTNQVVDSLKSETTLELENRLIDGQRLVQGGIATAVISQEASHEVGEEADALALTMEMQAKTLVVSEEDLDSLLNDLIGDLVPENYELSGLDKSIEVFGGELSGNSLSFTAKVRGFVVPEINKEDIIDGLAGRNLADAEAFLEAVPNIDSYEIKLWPPIPFISKSLPKARNRISVEITRK